jgi:hypothetical protein
VAEEAWHNLPAPFDDAASNYVIPEELLQRWTKLSLGDFVDVRLRRIDFDRLFFMNVQLATAVFQLQEAVNHLSNAELPKAQQAMTESVKQLQLHMGNNRAFLAGIIQNVAEGDRHE